jgi:hypothetical protein
MSPALLSIEKGWQHVLIHRHKKQFFPSNLIKLYGKRRCVSPDFHLSREGQMYTYLTAPSYHSTAHPNCSQTAPDLSEATTPTQLHSHLTHLTQKRSASTTPLACMHPTTEPHIRSHCRASCSTSADRPRSVGSMAFHQSPHAKPHRHSRKPISM